MKRRANKRAIRDMARRVEDHATPPTPRAVTARYCRVGASGCLVRLKPGHEICEFCARQDRGEAA